MLTSLKENTLTIWVGKSRFFSKTKQSRGCDLESLGLDSWRHILSFTLAAENVPQRHLLKCLDPKGQGTWEIQKDEAGISGFIFIPGLVPEQIEGGFQVKRKGDTEVT